MDVLMVTPLCGGAVWLLRRAPYFSKPARRGCVVWEGARAFLGEGVHARGGSTPSSWVRSRWTGGVDPLVMGAQQVDRGGRPLWGSPVPVRTVDVDGDVDVDDSSQHLGVPRENSHGGSFHAEFSKAARV